jgi:hypothetical protein
MTPFRDILLALALSGLVLAQNAKLSVTGAGDLGIRYGTPQWREELLKQASPGSSWRLGAGGATTLEASAALATKDAAVFPGDYNLNLRIGSEEEGWALIVHKDGTFFRGNSTEIASLPLAKSLITDKTKLASRLQIDLEASKDRALKAAGGSLIRIRFGPHQLETPLFVVGMAKKRLSLEATAFSIETLKLPARPEFQAILDGQAERPYPLGRLTLDRDRGTTILRLEGGEKPVLVLADFDRRVEGTRRSVPSPAPVLKVSVEDGQLRAQLGPTELAFPFEAAMLRKLGQAPEAGK